MIFKIYVCIIFDLVKFYCCDYKYDKYDKFRYGCKIKIKGIVLGLWG